MPPVKYDSREGKLLILKNKEIEKIIYAHSDHIGLLNLADQIICPIQPDLSKYQRTDCRAVTDSSKEKALERIMELTTLTEENFITRRIPMPFYPAQDTLVYIDKGTRGCVFFHIERNEGEGYKLWSAMKFSKRTLDEILATPSIENLNNPNFEN